MYAYKMYCLSRTRQTYYNRQVGKYTNWFSSAFLLHYYIISMRLACGKSTAGPTQRQESICRLHTSWILDSYRYLFASIVNVELIPGRLRGIIICISWFSFCCISVENEGKGIYEAHKLSESIKFYSQRICQKNTVGK